MRVLGLQGSPRKKGNSEFLLNRFLDVCRQQGADTELIRADGLNIQPCKELVVCEKKGVCPLKDEMEPTIYGQIRRADVVVLASPVFFYGVSAQLKVLIDRCQMFWGRRYKCKLADPAAGSRQGVLLSVGASGGRRLFDGVTLTARYFFDAVSAEFAESLTYRKVEGAGDIAHVNGVTEDIHGAATRVMDTVRNRPHLLFLSDNDACRSQIAAGFAGRAAGKDLRVLSAGLTPARVIDPGAEAYMAARGVDIKYRQPAELNTVLKAVNSISSPLHVICLGTDIPVPPGMDGRVWDLPPARDPAAIQAMGDQVNDRVARLVTGLLTDGAPSQ